MATDTQQGEMLKVDDLLIIPATFISVSFEKKNGPFFCCQNKVMREPRRCCVLKRERERHFSFEFLSRSKSIATSYQRRIEWGVSRRFFFFFLEWPKKKERRRGKTFFMFYGSAPSHKGNLVFIPSRTRKSLQKKWKKKSHGRCLADRTIILEEREKNN